MAGEANRSGYPDDDPGGVAGILTKAAREGTKGVQEGVHEGGGPGEGADSSEGADEKQAGGRRNAWGGGGGGRGKTAERAGEGEITLSWASLLETPGSPGPWVPEETEVAAMMPLDQHMVAALLSEDNLPLALPVPMESPMPIPIAEAEAVGDEVGGSLKN
eukprot:1191258-Prorocentrum_minimum.AAC.1